MTKQGYHGPLEQIDECCWRIPKSYKAGMRVDGRIFADERLIEQIRSDQAPEQVANVAFLPGIQMASLAMPDIHWGYGFCIGGVCATDPAEGGVISPGGVGYDINCGVRLVRTNLTLERRPAADAAADGRPVPPDSGRRGQGRAVPVRPQGAARGCMAEGVGYLEDRGLATRRRRRAHRGRRLPGRRRAGLASASGRSSGAATSAARSARATTSSKSRWSRRSSTTEAARVDGPRART